jgi:hypothetical protein
LEEFQRRLQQVEALCDKKVFGRVLGIPGMTLGRDLSISQ